MWWGGHGFGGRRFVSYMPFMVIGLVSVPGIPCAGVPDGACARPLRFPDWQQRALPAPSNQLFMRGFHEHRPRITLGDVWTVFAERFVVPFKLLAAWISS